VKTEPRKQDTQEKTLPTAQGELPKQKKLIAIFAGIAVLALVSYGIYLGKKGKDEFSEARDKVVQAFLKKDSVALLALANKEFTVGQPESDSGITLPPEKVIGKILQLAQNTRWSDRFQEFDNIRILYPESGSFQLLFVKNGTGWIWSGFLAINPEDLAALSVENPMPTEKNEYKEIQSDEAKGDEPSITD
jgi:hypothetical protein